ncbi:18637_t:CDS:2, partial [Racocetra persica]
HTDSNAISNSDTSPECNDTSNYFDKTSDTDHSNKNNNPNCSNKKPGNKPKLRKNPSWVWQYFRRRRPSRKWKTRENCTIIMKSKKAPNGQWECEQLVKTQGSTGNFQTHLNTYRITKPTKVIDTIEQPTITEMFHRAARQNTRQKESINYALVEWIVTDLQPLYVSKNESFIKLIYTLNPYYELSSDKYTACSKSEYIGVTCYFINSNYELKEAILAIKYASYSHDAVNIKAELEKIINDWRLFEKLLQIKHAIKLMKATMSADNDYIIPITTLTRNCTPLSMSISNKELDLTNMLTIFDEEEENIVDVDEELEIIITANGEIAVLILYNIIMCLTQFFF